MRLHRIALENLSSLYGGHTVDLDEDLGGASLFVIVGPTGAGKSTVLDAVSLALFGETPRLDNSRARDKGEDVDSRHIMSRGTGSCQAAVDFSRADGDGGRTRFRATWSCHRANRQADGAFQTARRALERARDDGTFELLVDDHRKKVYEPHFEAALDGLTVQDFQRSILLAQGEFTALLKASPDEKASILERLTSTEVYAEIGRRASHLRREATKAFEKAQARLEALNVMSPDELAELEGRQAAAAARLEAVRAELDRREAEVRWITRDEHLAAEHAAAGAAIEAARAARDAAAEELRRLAEDARCRPAAALAEAVTRAEAERAGLEERARALAARSAERSAALEPARAQREAAAAALAEATAARREAGPRLADARRSEEAARHARAAAETAAREAERAARERDEAESTLEDARRALAEAESRHTDAEAAWRSLAAAHGLPDHVSGLEARWARLAGEDARAQRLAAAAAAATDELASADAAVAAAREAVLEAESALSALGDAPRPPEALEAEDAALARRLDALRRADELAARAGEASRAVAERTNELDALLAGLEEGRELAAEERVLLKHARRERDAAAERLTDLELAISLIDHRDRLVDATPCPLCGSEHHPYRHDPAIGEKDRALRARHAAQATAVEEARLVVTRAEQALAARDKGVARDEGLAERLREDVDRAREASRQADAALATALEAAGLDDVGGIGPATAEASTRRAAVQAERRAAAALASARARVEQRASALALAEASRESAARRSEAARGAADEARAEAEALARGLADALAGHGIEAPRDGARGGLGEAVREASRRAATVRRAASGLEVSAREAEAAGSARDAATARAEEAEARWGRADAARRGTEAAAREAAARAAAGFDGEAPDAVEARLDAAVAAAQTALDEARDAIAGLERELASAAGEAGAVSERLEGVTARAERADNSLTAALSELGVADVADLRSRLLGEDERAALEERRASLSEAEASAVARREAATRNRREHAERRPAALADGVTAVVAQASAGTARKELVEASQELGALTNDVTRQQGQLRRFAEEKRDWEARRETMNLWRRLHRLIGEGDGRAFQEYAQTLNLQELVDRANGHLRALAPRYALVTATNAKGQARLDFAIRDTWLAGRQRPITTLSGGETFQVSLALALGLADMRTRGMPLETLLLDEGFGTLDPRALDHAVEALERLHARSRIQVGVISHVEALRERIEARVVVEALGNGHSRLRAELGAARAVPPPTD